MRRRQHHRAREETIGEPLFLRLTDAAEADLAEIWAYVAADSEAAATRLLDKIETTCAVLLDFPSAGTSRDRLARGLRVTFHRSYAIYYAVTATEVIIVRVLHGARDAAAIAEHGGFSAR
ncbi:type II toxin-antitoxin system RelE/ParE family toxin [Methylosinus sp. Ce-a6]|uniref:type II toxin-antitoxin system RelE/ParE family toxin n=1 Tax=Methylosinus sp. Ce-a6 TaxID=2172005 RepID=UPI001FCF1061|nr:type II toxin-antitoxin system RelE/ParE family toxin [Methylosinus sp. Ce-a6]